MAVSLGVTITQNSQSIANCTSNVTVSVYCWWSYGSWNINTNPMPAGWLTVDGVTYGFNNTFNDNRTANGSKTLFTLTLDIPHNSEGIKTVSCSASYVTGVSSGTIYASNSLKLTDIPRYARLEKAPDFTDESNPTIQYINPAGEAASSVRAGIALMDNTMIVAYRELSRTGNSYTFSLTEKERNDLRYATPTSNSMEVSFLIETVINGVTGVNSLASTMSIVNADPVVSPVIKDTNSVTLQVTQDASVLVALHSIAQVSINAVAKKGATIKSQQVIQGVKVLDSDGSFLVANSNPIYIEVVDSRGNSTTVPASNTIVPYLEPTCLIEQARPDGTGEIPLTVIGKVYSGPIGNTTNTIVVQYRNKAGYGQYSDWTTIDTVNFSENNFTAFVEIEGLDYKARHTFQARVIDSINTDGVVSAEKVFVAVPVFEWGPEDFQFNVPVKAEKLTGLTTPIEASDATSKEYVDDAVEEQQSKIDDLKKYADTKISMTILWENASPTSTFASQTIALDLSSYDSVQVEFDESWQAMSHRVNVGKNGSVQQIGDIYTDSPGYLYGASRDIRVTTTGVTFGDRLYKYANGQWCGVANQALIPFRIYGIKGIKMTKTAICGTFLCGEAVCG